MQGRGWAAAGRFGEAVGGYTDCAVVLGLVAPLHNALRSLHSSCLAGRAGHRGPALRQAQTVHWTVCVPAQPHRRARGQPSPGLAGGSVIFDAVHWRLRKAAGRPVPG